MASKKFLVDLDLQKNLLLKARLENGTTNPAGLAGSDTGYVFYNTSDKKIYIWTGTGWETSSIDFSEFSGDVLVDSSGVVTIQPGVVTTTKLADDAVTSAKILDSAVITSKIADDAVTNLKLDVMSANTIKGAIVAGNPVDLTAEEVRTIIGYTPGSEQANLAVGSITTTTVGVKDNTSGTEATLPSATTAAAGVMSAADKTTLDNLSSAPSTSDLTISNNQASGGAGDSPITVTLTDNNGHTTSHTIAIAANDMAGLFTGTEKGKLNNIAEGATNTVASELVFKTFSPTTVGAVFTSLSDISWVDNSNSLNPADPINKVSTTAAVKTYVDNKLSALGTFRGEYDANTNTPALEAADTSSIGINTGDYWVVTTGGTFYSKTLNPGDQLIANGANPGQESDWTIVQIEAKVASTSVQGVVYLATTGEMIAGAGGDPNDVATPAGVKAVIESEFAFNSTTTGNARRFHYELAATGSKSSWTVPHNLGKRNVQVQVFENFGNYEEVITGVRRPDINNVQIDFNYPPSIGDDYICVVEG